MAAIGDELALKTVRLGGRRQNDGSCRIAKQHGTCALRHVDAAAEQIGGNHQNGLALRPDKTISQNERIEKPGAGSRQIGRA